MRPFVAFVFYLTSRDIVPVIPDGKRVLMFQIPASPRNIVMRWKGIAYGRDGESKKPLNQAKMDEIRESLFHLSLMWIRFWLRSVTIPCESYL